MTLPLMMFAAGKGTRMQPLTQKMPKPMVTVAGKPLIDYALELATSAKANPIVVNTHYLPHQLHAHLAGSGVIFSDETTGLLDTGGGLRNALPLLGGNPVVTMNTDAVWKGGNPILHLIERWQTRMGALLLLAKKESLIGHKGAGDFSRDASGLLRRAPDLVYTGVQIINTDVLCEVPQDAFSLNAVWDILMQRNAIFGAVYDGQLCDVGQPESIPLAEGLLHV